MAHTKPAAYALMWRALFYAREIVHCALEVYKFFRAERSKRKKESPREMINGITPETRGEGRKLLSTDFGPGKITAFAPSDLGAGWRNVSALAGYRLNQFKNAIAYPTRITSAWRSPEKNRSVGGAKTSKHLTGEAFDVVIDDPKFFSDHRLRFYVDLARSVGFKGVGLYEGSKLIHVDVRPRPGAWAKVVREGVGKFINLAEFIDKYRVPIGGAVGGIGLLVLAIFLLASGRNSA